jgi:Flp pilus assembly protein CpaB
MIVAGLAAFLLVFSFLRSRDETFLIAVANVQLRAGTSVTEDALRFAGVDAVDRSVLGTFLSPEVSRTAVEEGWTVTRTVPAGDPVRMSDFRTEPTASDLRAMSIPIERGHAVAGVLQAGDIIDVIVVRKGVAGYVASGVEVLDVDGAESQFGGGFSVTVAVDAPTSLRVASALRDGAIELVRATGASAADPEDSYDPLSVDPDQG